MSDIKIIGSLTSPFVRVVRALCEELGLPYMLKDSGPFGKQDAEQNALISDNNPLLKVPVLIVDEQKIIDSRIISGYLIDRNAIPENSDFDGVRGVEEENVISIVIGIIEAGVLRFIMRGQEIDLDLPYLQRSLDRIEKGLAYLDGHKALGKKYSLSELYLICALDWFKKRNIIDWSGYKNLVAIHERIGEQAALVSTRIPENV